MAVKSISSEFTSDLSRADHERFPELFREGPMVDRHQAKRIVPMRVLVFGLMRTGTASMRVALSRLGFDDIYHMVSVFHNADDAQWWRRAADAKYEKQGTFTREDWDKLLGHCQAVCDIPPANFAEELIAAYPEAKVVILNRDVDKWYESMKTTVLLATEKPSLMKRLRVLLDWTESGQVSMMLGQLLRGLFGPDGINEENMKKVFVEYHENLRRIVPPEKRLEYRVQDGYEPLCDFLGVSVPTKRVNEKEVEESFPRVNEGSSFQERLKVSKRCGNRRIRKKLGVVGGVVALVGAGFYYLRRW